MKTIQFRLNGKRVAVNVGAGERLLDVLRGPLGQTDVKEGCGEGECGACTVLLDGKPVTSCILLAWQVDGREVTTVQGLDPTLFERISNAMVSEGAVQCGFCSPGFVLSISALLKSNPNPTRSEIQLALSGNLCRCTGYERIFRAVELLASQGGRR